MSAPAAISAASAARAEDASDRDLEDLYLALGHRFRRPELLRTALTHSSQAAATAPLFAPLDSRTLPVRQAAADNERLEFYGDTVLSKVLTKELMDRFPSLPEGGLNTIRKALVSNATLARVGQTLGIDRHLSIRGEPFDIRRCGAHHNALADATEAVLAAVLEDAGEHEGRKVIAGLFSPLINGFLPQMDLLPLIPRCPKNELQEWMAARGLPLPVYSLLAKEGEGHAPSFKAECKTATPERRGAGVGKTLVEAEQNAAKDVLRQPPFLFPDTILHPAHEVLTLGFVHR